MPTSKLARTRPGNAPEAADDNNDERLGKHIEVHTEIGRIRRGNLEHHREAAKALPRQKTELNNHF